VGSFKAVRFVLIYTMFLNLVATAAKLIVGFLTGSLSLIADGFDSLFDSISNVIGLIAIYIARRPPDEDHPYGHRRYEILLTMLISLLLFFTCFELLRSAYERFLNPVVPQITVWSFASLLLSIAVHVYVAIYEKRKGEELRSEFLIADAMHTRADIFVSVGVMLGLIVVRAGYPILDVVLAVVIAVLIAKIGFEIVANSTRILTDARAVDVDKVAAIIQQVPGVTSSHHIRSRGQEDDIHLDLHIRVPARMPVAQAHMVAHQVQRKLLESIPGTRDVLVHIEPQPSGGHASGSDTLAGIRKAAQESGEAIHHLIGDEIGGKYFVDLHLEVPDDLTLGQAHARASRLEERIKTGWPEIDQVSIHIEPAVPAIRVCEQLGEAELQRMISAVTHSVPGVFECEATQAHWMEGKLFLAVRCILDETLPVAQAHDIATAIEDRLRRWCPEIAYVSVHMEPACRENPSAGG